MGRILVTGGAGYFGSVLVPKLIADGHCVVVYDTLESGAEGFESNPSLRVVKADIRDIESFKQAVAKSGAVIHLAGVPSDPPRVVEASPVEDEAEGAATKEAAPATNVEIPSTPFERIVKTSRGAGVRRFIHVTSGTLYGATENVDVTEDHPLLPTTEEDKALAASEGILLDHHGDDFTTVVLRIATLSGLSPRMRFDGRANQFANDALNHGVVNLPTSLTKQANLSVEDLADLHARILRAPSRLIAGQIFNVAAENLTHREAAEIVREVVAREFPDREPVTFETTCSDAYRGGSLSSRKLAETLEWTPQRRLEDDIAEICQAFRHAQIEKRHAAPEEESIASEAPALTV